MFCPFLGPVMSHAPCPDVKSSRGEASWPEKRVKGFFRRWGRFKSDLLLLPDSCRALASVLWALKTSRAATMGSLFAAAPGPALLWLCWHCRWANAPVGPAMGDKACSCASFHFLSMPKLGQGLPPAPPRVP